MKALVPVIVLFTLSAPSSAAVIRVSASASGANSGTSWADAYTSLTAALESATSGDEIWVAAGAYGPITLKDGVRIIGGFAGNESEASQSNPETNLTYLTGHGTTRAVSGSDCSDATVLYGFVITDGVLEDMTEAGAGLRLENCDATIVRCVLSNNAARYAGGAAANYGGSPTFVNCRFVRNGALNGIEPVGAGGFFNYAGNPRFINCLFHGNRGGDGGAVVVHFGRPEFINCTFSGNQATQRFGGAIYDTRGESIVRNSILWGNTAREAASQEVYHSHLYDKTDIAHSNVRGGWPGAGNIDADPLFIDASGGDFRLKGNSPCRDAGRDEYLPPEPAHLNLGGTTAPRVSADLRMHGRIEDGAVDMGAFERSSSDP